jgi:4-carboxymuconolactone decarboxylase
MTDEFVMKGVATRDEMLGPEHGSAKLFVVTDFRRDFEDLVTRYCFAEVWGREQLPRNIRSMVTIAMLIGLGRFEDVGVHVKGAINNGVTREQIREIMIHSTIYCGVPAAKASIETAEAVLDGMGA